jgi:hypothetical protein
VEDCLAYCRRATADQDYDGECTACLLDSLFWYTPAAGCSDWECVCLPWGPEVGASSCTDECAESFERRDRRRAEESAAHNARVLEMRSELIQDSRAGWLPDLEHVLPELGGIAVHETPDEGLFFTTAQEHREVAVGRLAADLSLQWSLPADGGREYAPLLTAVALADGGAFVLEGAGQDELVRYGADGEVLLRFGVSSWTRDIAPAPAGRGAIARLTVAEGTPAAQTIELLDDHGAVLDRIALRPDIDAHLLQPTPGGGFVLAGGDGPVRVLELAAGGEAPEVLWEVMVMGDREPDSVSRDVARALAVHDDGSVLVGGTLTANRELGRYGEPFASLIVDGELLWTWTPATDPVLGSVRGVALGADGRVYTAGNEDPHHFRNDDPDDPCSTYSCSGITVRAFEADGTARWMYAHQRGLSEALSIVARARGDLLVSGRSDRDGASALLLRFDDP